MEPQSRLVGGNETESVSFTCIVTGAPSLRVSWFKNGENLTDLLQSCLGCSHYTFIEMIESDTRVFSTFTIDEATYEDNGQYVCVATVLGDGSDDEQFTTKKSATLTVLGELILILL